MADIRLAKPAAGASESVQCAPDARFVFDFPTTDATLGRDGDNPNIRFEDGSQLQGFYQEYNGDKLPSSSIDFLRPGVNMLELPAHDAPGAALAALVTRSRDGEPAPRARMARRYVLAHFSEAMVVPRHLAEVMRAYTAWQKERGA